ncbi:hypothetical protein BGX38DRAFT_1210913 [Terfezia claveryi]|nr:hypothetical protein BGX38DRAFT_1210913 [Terfezia claveryi]
MGFAWASESSAPQRIIGIYDIHSGGFLHTTHFISSWLRWQGVRTGVFHSSRLLIFLVPTCETFCGLLLASGFQLGFMVHYYLRIPLSVH